MKFLSGVSAWLIVSAPVASERHADRIGSVSRLDQRGSLDRRFERVGRHERDRLATIGDGRREHRLQALKAVTSGHQETGGFHIAEVPVREDQPHA
jgi:hypothetical protein